MLEPNTILQSRYRILQQLGHGGMGAVYQAMDENLSCLVAVKETFATTDEHRRAFEREAKLLANLSHPALPRVTHHFTEGAGQFLVMQFIPGNDLAELIALRERPFPTLKVLEWADQLLDALEELHSYRPPIVHRDIKPSNLKLTPKGKVILLDFGLAKGAAGHMSTVDAHSYSQSIYGYTCHFAPLEQIRGVGTDTRSDLYSLAATLWNLLTAQAPPDALGRVADKEDDGADPLRPANELNPEVAAPVAAVLHQAMALNRNQRPQSAAEMRSALYEAARTFQPPQSSDVPAQLAVDSSLRREEEERQRREEEERERRRLEAEEEARRAAEEEMRRREEERLRRELEERRKRAMEEARRLAEEEEALKRVEQEASRRRAEAEALRRVEAARTAAEEEVRRKEEEERRKREAEVKERLAREAREAERQRIEERGRAIERQRVAERERRVDPAATIPYVSLETSRSNTEDVAPPQPIPAGEKEITEGRKSNRTPLIVVAALVLILGIVVVIWVSRTGRNEQPSSTESQPSQVQQQQTNQTVNPQTTPAGMAYVPGGDFLMGRDGDETGYESPAHKVTVKPFFVDLYEVTREDFKKCLDANQCPVPQGWTNGTYPSGTGRYPVTGVTWDGANAYAMWAGKRLPTEEEWEFAARGTDGRRYPWGNDWRAGQTNADNASGGMVEVGKNKGASPFGAFDMVGNAWEWTSSNLIPYPGGTLSVKVSNDLKVIRGGTYLSNRNQATTTYRRGWRASGEDDYGNTGFRCVKDIANPSSK